MEWNDVIGNTLHGQITLQKNDFSALQKRGLCAIGLPNPFGYEKRQYERHVVIEFRMSLFIETVLC